MILAVSQSLGRQAGRQAGGEGRKEALGRDRSSRRRGESAKEGKPII